MTLCYKGKYHFKMKSLFIFLSFFLFFSAFGDKTKQIPRRIIEAIQKGDLKKVKTYVNSGNRINDKEPYYGRDLLQFASLELESEIVKFLSENGFNANTPTRISDFPVHLAIEGEYGDSYIGGVSTKVEHQFPPLNKNLYQTLKVLIEAKANLNTYNRDYLTPLLMVVPYTELMEFLLENGSDPELPDVFGRTAFNIAKGYKYKDAMKLLIKYTESPSLKRKRQCLLTFVRFLKYKSRF